MLWSIDSGQNRVSAYQCHRKTVSRVQVYRKIKVHTKFLLLTLAKSTILRLTFKVAAVQHTPEYRFGWRKNFKMDNGNF